MLVGTKLLLLGFRTFSFILKLFYYAKYPESMIKNTFVYLTSASTVDVSLGLLDPRIEDEPRLKVLSWIIVLKLPTDLVDNICLTLSV